MKTDVNGEENQMTKMSILMIMTCERKSEESAISKENDNNDVMKWLNNNDSKLLANSMSIFNEMTAYYQWRRSHRV